MEISEVQSKTLDIVKCFDSICAKNDIWYTLTSGSVLGAVRHKGFIPWDSDMDVFIRIGDIERLRHNLLEALPEQMKLNMWDREPGYHMCFDRISFANISHYKVHLDIFPLIGAPERKINRKIFTEICFYSYKFLRCKHVDIRYSKEAHVKKIRLVKKFAGLIPDNVIRRWYYYLQNQYDFERSKYVYTIASGYGFNECLPKELLLNTTRVPFEDVMLPIPADYHEYLTKVYGDYMTPKREGYKKLS